jgi:hypothetical protein
MWSPTPQARSEHSAGRHSPGLHCSILSRFFEIVQGKAAFKRQVYDTSQALPGTSCPTAPRSDWIALVALVSLAGSCVPQP